MRSNVSIILHNEDPPLNFFLIIFGFTGAENKFAKFLLCCLKCCFWCLEKFIKFINRNAYIMVRVFNFKF